MAAMPPYRDCIGLRRKSNPVDNRSDCGRIALLGADNLTFHSTARGAVCDGVFVAPFAIFVLGRCPFVGVARPARSTDFVDGRFVAKRCFTDSMGTVFMPIIEGFWVRNFRCLKQIAIGSSFQQSVVLEGENDLSPYELTALTTLIGSSGRGKSTILDVFAFLADCLKEGLEVAFARRGGFEAVYSQEAEGPISIGLVFRACSEPRPLTYALNITKGVGGIHVESEVLVYRGTQHGAITQPILFFQNGSKSTRHIAPWHGAKSQTLDKIRRVDSRHLGLTELGHIEDIPDVPWLKIHLEGFHYACYRPDNAVGLSPVPHRNPRDIRLATEFKRMEEKHQFELPGILQTIAKRIPKIEDIHYEKTESGRTILYFKDQRFPVPFTANQVSEGVLRLFAHFLLLEDSVPSPLLGIEEPDCYLDSEQIKAFAHAVRNHVAEIGGSQFLLTTHQPSLADWMDPNEVWILYDDADGFPQVCRAYDEIVYQGVDLNAVGPGWYSEFLHGKFL